MKLTAVFLAAFLVITAILAMPTDPPFAITHHPRLKTLLTHNTDDTPPDGVPPESPPAETYDQNWAGAVLTGAGYRTVTGTVTVPSLRVPPGASSNELHAVSAWVGIDGDFACPNAMLQAGVDMYLNNSIPSYWAWYVLSLLCILEHSIPLSY